MCFAANADTVGAGAVYTDVVCVASNADTVGAGAVYIQMLSVLLTCAVSVGASAEYCLQMLSVLLLRRTLLLLQMLLL